MIFSFGMISGIFIEFATKYSKSYFLFQEIADLLEVVALRACISAISQNMTMTAIIAGGHLLLLIFV